MQGGLTTTVKDRESRMVGKNPCRTRGRGPRCRGRGRVLRNQKSTNKRKKNRSRRHLKKKGARDSRSVEKTYIRQKKCLERKTNARPLLGAVLRKKKEKEKRKL